MRRPASKSVRKDLIPFGSLSEAELHTITYPNGDLPHCFALLFLARQWSGQLQVDRAEVSEARFADRMAPPQPIHGPTAEALQLLARFHSSGQFQLR